MTNRRKPKPATPVLLAVSDDDAAEWFATHPTVDAEVLTPETGKPSGPVSRAYITRAMVAHPDRVSLMRAAREAVPTEDDTTE